MRTRTPPLAPGEQPCDVTVYIVLNDFGERLGHTYVKTYVTEADEKSVISNILSGDYSNPMRVVAFNTVEGWSGGVTEDIARYVLERGESEAPLSEYGKRFVERV